jgi:hypothetical protein
MGGRGKRPSRLERLETRLIESIAFEPARRELTVRFDDGACLVVSIDHFKFPTGAEIKSVNVDEFRRGIEFWLADGRMHDVGLIRSGRQFSYAASLRGSVRCVLSCSAGLA